MYEFVDVERITDGGKVKWRWRFWFDTGALWLDSYIEYTRPTLRHKFTPTISYTRLSERYSTLKEIDVVLPHDVKQEAIEKFVRGITVKKWSQRHST